MARGREMAEDTELLLRILADVPPPAMAEAAYLFAQTLPNQESVFVAARKLLESGAARQILISDCSAKSGYAGAAAWRDALLTQYALAEGQVQDVPMEPTDILHTLLEAEAVVRFAKARGDERLIIVASPFHQERAFISAVSVALREYPGLKLYSTPGTAQPWNEVVTHSQGTLEATRAELTATERARIEKYTAKGDLAPRAKVLQYLRSRD